MLVYCKRPLVVVILVLTMSLIQSSSPVYADPATYYLSVQPSYTFGYGQSPSVAVTVTCQNTYQDCSCQGSFTGRSSTNFVAGKKYTLTYSENAHSCDTGRNIITFNAVCITFWDSTQVRHDASFEIIWPTPAEKSIYDTASSKITSTSSKINSAAASINDATSKINNAQSYGSACVDVSQAASSLQTAQSKKTTAATYYSYASSSWNSCQYPQARDYASSADSEASQAISYASSAGASAQSTINAYNDNVKKANSDISRADSTIQSARTAIDNAQDRIDRAKSKSSCIPVSNIETRVSSARSNVANAINLRNSADAAKTSCSFSNVASYASTAASDANSARTTALTAEQEIITLESNYDKQKISSDIEINSARQLLDSARAEVNRAETKLKETGTASCVEEVGLSSGVALKTEAESSLSSANEEFTLATSNSQSCNFLAAIASAKKAQDLANRAKPKATEAAIMADSIAESVVKIKSSIGAFFAIVDNKISIVESFDNKMGSLLETHPQETLGEMVFSEAKAKREHGREKIKAAKTDFERAGIDFRSGSCTKSNNSLNSAYKYAIEAEGLVTDAHNYTVLKIQELGDCAKRINGATDEVNKLYFKTEFGRVYLPDALDNLINITGHKQVNIEYPHINKLRNSIREDADNVLSNLSRSNRRLDEGNFGECLISASLAREGAIKVRQKSDEAVTEIVQDLQTYSPTLLEYYSKENAATKAQIEGKLAITEKEVIDEAKAKAKENDKIVEEIKLDVETISKAKGLDPVIETSLKSVARVNKLESNTKAIREEILPKVNKTFYRYLVFGGLLAAIAGTGVYGIRRLKKKEGVSTLQLLSGGVSRASQLVKLAFDSLLSATKSSIGKGRSKGRSLAEELRKRIRRRSERSETQPPGDKNEGQSGQ